MDVKQIMHIVESSYRARHIMDTALREIDRRALNAMVLVKRHGKALAGYGVIAQSFREQAARLKRAASRLPEVMSPLIYAQMCIFKHQHHVKQMSVLKKLLIHDDAVKHNFEYALNQWQTRIKQEERDSRKIFKKVIRQMESLQAIIEEQEYIVVNARIEAALLEETGVPLMRVSKDMGTAVATIRKAVWIYRNQLEELLHESSTRI